MQFIPVTGMHRSGTSVVARILAHLGADLGDPERWLNPKADNPEGFVELRSIVQLNDDLLAWLGGRWDRPPHLRPDWATSDDATLVEFVERGREVLEHEFPTTPAFIKDPRLSVLLPFWRRVADFGNPILVVRHPASVHRSLQRRNGLSVEQSARLYRTYVSHVLASDPAATIVIYQDLLTDPGATVQALAERVGTAGDADVEGAIALVDPTRAAPPEPIPGLELETLFYDAIRRRDPGAFALAKALREGDSHRASAEHTTRRLADEAARATRYGTERRELKETLEVTARHRDELTAERDKAMDLLHTRDRELSEARDTVARLRGEVETHRAAIEALEADTAAASELQRSYDQLTKESHTQTMRLRERELFLSRAERLAQQRGERIVELEADIQRISDQLAAYHQHIKDVEADRNRILAHYAKLSGTSASESAQ